MERADLARIQDAKLHARSALAVVGPDGVPGVATMSWRLHALFFNLVVVGEALGHVSPPARSLAPDLPWKLAKDTRNRLVHGYWQIDLDIVAGIVERRLPSLIDQLDALVALLTRTEP